MNIAKFNLGDKVKIVKYGGLIWENKLYEQIPHNFPIYKENDTIVIYDIHHHLIGKEAIVASVSNTQYRPKYILSGIDPVAWYNEEQLELVV